MSYSLYSFWEKVKLRVIDFIDTHWNGKYCWAQLVCWALGSHPFSEVSETTKCGYCYNCFTKEEAEADWERIRNQPKTVK